MPIFDEAIFDPVIFDALAPTAEATNPKIAVSVRGVLTVTFDDGSECYATYSYDQAATWSVPVSLALGTHPCPCSDRNAGIEYVCFFDDPDWKVLRRTPDELVFSVVGTITDAVPAGTTGFHVDSNKDGALVFVGSDGTAVRRWESYDQGATFIEV